MTKDHWQPVQTSGMIPNMPDGQPSQAMRDLGDELRAALDKLGWSERRLADQAGVSPQMVTNLALGYAAHRPGLSWKPREENVVKIATTLRNHGVDVSVTGWLKATGHDNPSYVDTGESGAVQGRRIGGKAQHLQPSERKIVEDLVDALLEAHGYVLPAESMASPVSSRYEFASDGVQSRWEEQPAADRQRVGD